MGQSNNTRHFCGGTFRPPPMWHFTLLNNDIRVWKEKMFTLNFLDPSLSSLEYGVLFEQPSALKQNNPFSKMKPRQYYILDISMCWHHEWKKNPIKVFVWSWQNSIDTNISWVELQVRYLRRVQLFFPFLEKGIRSDKERYVIVNLVYST